MAKVKFPLMVPEAYGQVGKQIVFYRRKDGIVAGSYPSSQVGRNNSALPQVKMFSQAMSHWRQFRLYPEFICSFNLRAVVSSYGINGDSYFVKQFFKGVKSGKQFLPIQIYNYKIDGSNITVNFNSNVPENFFLNFGNSKTVQNISVSIPPNVSSFTFPIPHGVSLYDFYLSFSVNSQNFFVISPIYHYY